MTYKEILIVALVLGLIARTHRLDERTFTEACCQ